MHQKEDNALALDMKATIAESFNSLVRQRGIDKVTVKAVIEDCGISRQTFYYHFQDIMDVVEWCARQATQRMVERSLAAGSAHEALSELIRSTADNYALLRKLMNSQRREQIERILGQAARSYLEELIRRKSPALQASYCDAELALDFLTFGLVGTLLKHCGEPDLDPDALAEQIIRILSAKLPIAGNQ